MIQRLPITVDLEGIKVPVRVEGAEDNLTIHARIRGNLELAIGTADQEEIWVDDQEGAESSAPILIRTEDGNTASLRAARERGFAAARAAQKKKQRKRSKEPVKASSLPRD